MSWNIAYTAQALRFAEVIAVAMSETPMQRLLEADVCRNYYRLHDPSVIAIDDSISEALCKIPGVQKLVADVNGPTYALSFFPALLGALPYVLPSYLTNKHRTLLVNVVGSLLGKSYYLAILYFYNTFNPRWIWLSAMSNFIGGGDIVFYSLSQALVAESIPSQSLSSFYLYSTAVALFAKMAAGAAGLSLMSISVWIPIMISLAIKFLDIPVILFLLRISDKTGFRLVPTDEEDAALQDADTSTKEDTAAPSWRSLFDRKSVIYLHAFPLGIIALYELAISMRLILPYWLSSRWHTTLQEVGFIRLGEMLLTAAVVSGLPRFSRLLERPVDGEGSSKSRDLVLAKTCLGFTLIGTVLMGFSWYKFSGIVSLVVLTGGVGFEDAYLSFVTAKLQKEEIAQFYLIVGMVALGSIYIGGTAVSWVYSLSLAYGETWLTSLPIWSCALPVLCALALLQRRQV